GIEALEVAHLALAEHQDACRLEVLVESGQRQAGLLDMRARDGPVQPGAAGEQLDGEVLRFRGALEQRGDGDGRHPGLSVHDAATPAYGCGGASWRRDVPCGG